MTKHARVLDRVLSGTADASIRFDELRSLPVHPGFDERVRGSHQIFTKVGIGEILNIQARGSQGKPYQVKEVRRVVLHTSSEEAMANDRRYEIIIYWSNEDQAFIAEVPELAGCAADGSTYQEAVAHAQVAIDEWIETAASLGRQVPTPRRAAEICLTRGGTRLASLSSAARPSS